MCHVPHKDCPEVFEKSLLPLSLTTVTVKCTCYPDLDDGPCCGPEEGVPPSFSAGALCGADKDALQCITAAMKE